MSLPSTRTRRRLKLTVSIGVAVRQPRGAGVDRLLTLSDNALYEAKRTGRDRVVVAPVDEPVPLGDEARGRTSSGRARG